MKPGQFGKLGSKLALLFIFIGLAAILAGWNGAAGNIALAAQIPYIVSGGMGGMGSMHLALKAASMGAIPCSMWR